MTYYSKHRIKSHNMEELEANAQIGNKDNASLFGKNN